MENGGNDEFPDNTATKGFKAFRDPPGYDSTGKEMLFSKTTPRGCTQQKTANIWLTGFIFERVAVNCQFFPCLLELPLIALLGDQACHIINVNHTLIVGSILHAGSVITRATIGEGTIP